MDILNQLVAGMNKEEIRYFKLYTSRIKSSESRKDLLLFDYIRKSGDSYDEEKILKKLYNSDDKNSFYRLKNRLIEELNKCLMAQHHDEDDTIYVFHLLSLVKFYFSKNNFRLALRFIRKAEDKAKKIENYELLDIIYGELIKLSHEIVSINPEEYINKRKENRIQLNSVRQLDDILAAVRYRLKITQNFSEKDNPLLSILQNTIDDFSQDKEIKKSPKLRFMLYTAVSQVLLQKHDYKTLEDYLIKTYTQFNKEKLFNKGNHDTKLQMLTFLVNALFKNKKLKISLKYAEELKEAMSEYNKVLYNKYLFFYYNSLVINYSILDIDKAIKTLEELKDNDTLKNTPFYEHFIYLNLAVFWFDKQQYHNAIKNLNKLYLHNNYKNADTTLKFKIAIAELMIRYELQDYDFLEHKIVQIKKDYKVLLAKKEHEKEKQFIDIVKNMIVTDNIKRDKNVHEQIRKFINNNVLDDTEIIKYNNWLQVKI